MKRISFNCLLISALLLSRASAAEHVDYAKEIKPLLQERCFACHGVLAQKGKLRLDSGLHIFTGGKTGPAIVAKKAANSLLLERVTAKDDDARMPPEGLPLTVEQIAKLQLWIEQGAAFPLDDKPETDSRDHWSFRSPVRPAVPKSKLTNPIDSFVEAQWHRRGLVPVPETDQRLLLRRLYLDLIGLPPTSDEIETFVNDRSPNAYEELADKLLSSPQYGERWGRHFLDIWRYSDWWGLGTEVRNSQKHIWHWRDWAIESMNADLPYDEMIRQMLAADELYPTDVSKLRASGFLARQYFKFSRNSWLDETVEHTSKAFLGLTYNCAKCHDHKYDPIRQEDYYRLRAFFEPYQVRTDMVADVGDFERDGIPRAFDCNANVPTYLFVRGDDKQPRTDKPLSPGVPAFLSLKLPIIREVKLPLEAYQPGLRPLIMATYRQAANEKVRIAEETIFTNMKKSTLEQVAISQKALAVAIAKRTSLESRIHADAVTEDKARAMVAVRDEKLVAVANAELELAKLLAKPMAHKPIDPKRVMGRIALANARRAVEQPSDKYTPVRGALKTLESNLESEASRNKPFPQSSTGRRTALALWITDKSNPLTARVAVNHIWLRHFGKPLVPSVFDFGRKGLAPSHPELLDWLAVEFVERGWSMKHIHRLIVTSRVYRLSSSTAGSDIANRRVDPENRYLWFRNPMRMDANTVRDSLLKLNGELDSTLGGVAVPPAQQSTSKRRSIYFFQSHNEHDKFLSLFDDANVLECYRRTDSIVPQQALALANSQFAMNSAEKIASQMAKIGDEKAYIRVAFERLLGASPTAEELSVCTTSLATFRETTIGTEAAKTARARLNLIHALLNHNDFVTIR